MENQATGSAWDSRNEFPKEIVKRIDLFLDTNMNQFSDKIETLTDIHDCVNAWEEKEVYDHIEEMLDKIHTIMFITDGKLSSERAKDITEATKLIRKTYRAIMIEIRKQGLLLPEKIVFDEFEELEKSY